MTVEYNIMPAKIEKPRTNPETIDIDRRLLRVIELTVLATDEPIPLMEIERTVLATDELFPLTLETRPFLGISTSSHGRMVFAIIDPP
jgi:hypothetical protein